MFFFFFSDNLSRNSCKQYRNKLHHLIRISKKRRYIEKFEQTQGNVKKTWSLIIEVMNKNKSNKNFPNTFTYNENEITDPYEIANKFNDILLM